MDLLELLYRRRILETQILLDLILYEQRQLERLQRMGRPRQGNRFTLDQWSERQCKEETRFTKTELRRIKTLLRIPDMMQTSGHDLFTGIEGLCILLYRTTGPVVYRRMQNTFHRDRGAMSRIFSCMLEWMDDHWSRILDWDQDRLTPNRLQAFVHTNDARSLQGHGSDMTSLDVFGFIDGMSRQVCRPTYEHTAMYSGHGNTHVLRYHVVVTPDGIIVHVSQPQAGTCDDATIFADSTLPTWLERCAWASDGRPLKVLGDSAYEASVHIARPFVASPSMPAAVRRHNARLHSVRCTVEQAINNVATQCQQVTWYRSLRILSGRVGHYFQLGVLFANIYTILHGGNDISVQFDVDPPTLEEYLNPNVYSD